MTIQVTPADPDAKLKSELRERWIDAHPDHQAALAALALAETTAKAPAWNADPLAYVAGAKTARAAIDVARANIATVRAQLGATYDNAVKVAPVSVDIPTLPGTPGVPVPLPTPLPD